MFETRACAASPTLEFSPLPLGAAGIDAPLFWTPSGDRKVDAVVRTIICKHGASPGTVSHVSSLRGACLVQGIVAAMLLRERLPTLPLTEGHPKAVLWMLGEATPLRKAVRVTIRTLSRYFYLGSHSMLADHERDAALGALAAWAMIHRAAGWEDIRGRDPDAISPLVEPLGYLVPALNGRIGSLGDKNA
jgi:hypothetical protein